MFFVRQLLLDIFVIINDTTSRLYTRIIHNHKLTIRFGMYNIGALN